MFVSEHSDWCELSRLNCRPQAALTSGNDSGSHYLAPINAEREQSFPLHRSSQKWLKG